MKQRIITMLLALVLICSIVPQAAPQAEAAGAYKINGVTVRYTDFPTEPNDCWMYANNLYNKIWGTYFSNSFDESSNMLRKLKDSQLTLTKAHLKAYVSAAKVGSVLRICDEYYLHSHDGWGHSQLIVQKDSNGFTVLEGGLSNYPYCQEKYYTWSEYINTSWLGGQYEYIKYIKYPGAPAYTPVIEKTYPAYGYIEITKTTTVRSLPCASSLSSDSVKIEDAVKGATYPIIQLAKNSAGNLWYKVKTESGKYGYIYAPRTEYLRHRTTDIKITDAKAPSTHDLGEPYTLTGTVKSTRNKLTKVSAYIYAGEGTKGEKVTGGSDTVSNNSYNLKNSEIDSETLFDKLPVGTYTYVVSATYKSYYAKDATTVASKTGTVQLYTKTFKVLGDVENCTHSYKATVTTEATCEAKGVKNYFCKKCGDSYNKNIAATGHSYGSWETVMNATCTADGSKQRTCSACSAVETNAIAAHGLTHVAAVEPTCGVSGNIAHWKCEACSRYYADEAGANELTFEQTRLTAPSYSTSSNGSVYAISRLHDDGVRLMDGSMRNTDTKSAAYSAWNASEVEILIDLGTEKAVSSFSACAAYGFWGVQAPESISVQYSNDGITYTDYIADPVTGDIAQGLVSMTVSGDAVSARYIRVTIFGNGGFIWLDEIQIN